MQSAGELLLSYRESSKPPVLQAEMGKLLGVSQPTFVRWEKDQSPIPDTKWELVMEVLGVSWPQLAEALLESGRRRPDRTRRRVR